MSWYLIIVLLIILRWQIKARQEDYNPLTRSPSTMRSYWAFLVILSMTLLCLIIEPSDACNEATCAPQVSKCMLLKSCECDMSNKDNCTCCKDCQVCLASLYIDCCTCVGKFASVFLNCSDIFYACIIVLSRGPMRNQESTS